MTESGTMHETLAVLLAEIFTPAELDDARRKVQFGEWSIITGPVVYRRAENPSCQNAGPDLQ